MLYKNINEKHEKKNEESNLVNIISLELYF